MRLRRVAAAIASIDRLDIFELYEDRAIEAVHVLRWRARARSSTTSSSKTSWCLAPDGQRRTRIESGQAGVNACA